MQGRGTIAPQMYTDDIFSKLLVVGHVENEPLHFALEVISYYISVKFDLYA
jgi:hypothetical protein